MPLVIQNTATVPPEDWVYDVNGFVISAKYYDNLYPQIVKHCTANNIPVPSVQDVIDRLCATLTIPCYEGRTPLVNKWQEGVFALKPCGGCGG